jgi:putative transposase
VVTTIKSVKQPYSTTEEILTMMEKFRHMVNDCLRIGLRNDISTMKKLSKLCYPLLAKYDIVTYYKLHAISKAAGMLATRKKSLRRGHITKDPYMRKPCLISSYGFKITNGILKVPLGNERYFDIPLNRYAKDVLLDLTPALRSFTLTPETLSINYSKEAQDIECTKTAGIDRNLENLTVGNEEHVTRYNLAKAGRIAESTCSIVSSFKRNDVRIRKKIASKYGKRRANRIRQLMHHVSKAVVEKAKEQKTAIIFEDIRFIRRMYQSGNGQGRNHRFKLNSWSFSEIKRQIGYKAA